MGGMVEPGRWAVLAILLAVATLADLRARRIPNWLTFAGCVAGLVLGALASGVGGFLLAGKGLLLAFAISLPFWLAGWVGAGDVKLLAAVGAFVGSGLVIQTLLAVGIAGAVLAVGALLWRGLLARTGERVAATLSLSLASRRWHYVAPDAQESAVRLPYAVAITAGTFAAVVLFG